MLFFSIEELSLYFPFESWESKDGCNQERMVESCAKDFLGWIPKSLQLSYCSQEYSDSELGVASWGGCFFAAWCCGEAQALLRVAYMAASNHPASSAPESLLPKPQVCAKRSSGIYFGFPTILIFPSKTLDVIGQILATSPRPFTSYEHC